VNAFVFLVLAVVLAVVGSAVVWYRMRTPRSVASGIDDFQREMQALAPRVDDRGRRRREPWKA
jgi:hypothetical protein